MKKPTLLEVYHQQLEGQTVAQQRFLRRLWFATVRRYLVLLSLSSDPVPAYPDGDHIRGFAPFFLNRDVAELEEVYRATRPQKNRKKPSS